MPRTAKPKLPPIVVEDRSEKLSIAIPTPLHKQLEAFSDYFVETSGQKPSSLNAVIVGLLTGYIDSHRAFQKWQKTKVNGHGGAV